MNQIALVTLILFLLFGSCRNPSPRGLSPDRPLHINQIQVIGSHNSYKQAIEPALQEIISNYDSATAAELQYAHTPIYDQLELGLRNLEIDVYADSKGGKFSNPRGLKLAAPVAPFDPDSLMIKPGFKVFHIPDIDFRTSCYTLGTCLKELKKWSEENPGHTPVFVTLEAKDGQGEMAKKFGLAEPEIFTSKLFDPLDSVISINLGENRLITPDRIRGSYKTLEEAVLNSNWPTLDESKGKFLFVLDDSGRKRDLYLQDHPSLKGRVLFVNADPGTPEAATLIRNDPRDTSITRLVKQGYIIRTRADAGTKEARLDDHSGFEAACHSGAQIITTDYYQESAFFNSQYKVFFEDTTYFRTNPLFNDKSKK